MKHDINIGEEREEMKRNFEIIYSVWIRIKLFNLRNI